MAARFQLSECLLSADKEEKDQCNKMHSIIKDYKLDGEFRWLVAQKDPVRNGELYRYIAGGPDTRNPTFKSCFPAPAASVML